MTQAPFEVGDLVEVWSNSKKIWFVGSVEDISPPGGIGSVIEGCVKVRFGRKLEKWILPTDFGRVLRRHSPRFYVPDPRRPPLTLLKNVRKRCYVDVQPVRTIFSSAPPSANPTLTVDNLVDMWKYALGEEEDRTITDETELAQIRKNVRDIFVQCGVQMTQKVSVDEFVHFSLLLVFPPGRAVKQHIADELSRSRSTTLSEVVGLWMRMDRYCTGRILIADLEEALTDAGVGGWNSTVEEEAKSILHDIDGDDYASVAYCDFVAKYFRLSCVEVCLSWYDISNGWSKYISPLVLFQQEAGVWHTGLVVFGQEFYYSGRIYRGRPGATPYGFPTKIQRLGLTTRTHKDFEEFVIRELDGKFTEDKYDFLEHNCNNFTNQAVFFLLGDQIPEEIRLQPTRAMSAPLPMIFRPWVNQWLGRADGDQTVSRRSSNTSNASETPRDDIAEGCMVFYSPQGSGNRVLAQVLKKHPQGSCDIRWRDRGMDGKDISREAKNVPTALLQLSQAPEQYSACTIA